MSRVVDLAARRTSEAARSSAEAETLSTLAGSLLRGEQALPALLERVQETFAVEQRQPAAPRDDAPAAPGRPAQAAGRPARHLACVASVGDDPCLRPEDGDTEVPVGDDLLLVLRGRTAGRRGPARAGRVRRAGRGRLPSSASWPRRPRAAEPLAETDRMRTALLNAVSHDLRTPIASAKAAVSSLRSSDVTWTDARPRANCSPTPTPPSTGSPTWSPTCSTCPGCRPACCR